MDEDIEIIELLDENGESVRFEFLLAFDYDNKRYIALHPMDDPDVDEGAVIFMETVTENEEENLQVVESDILNEELFQEFMTILESMEEDGEEDDE